MYGGQPPLQSHQIQHVPQTFDPSVAATSAELQVESHHPALAAIPPGMTSSHYNNLPYPFQGIPDPSALMSLTDHQTGSPHHASFSTDGFAQRAPVMTSTHAPIDSINAMTVPRASFDTGSDGGVRSLAASEDGAVEAKSPGLADTFEDSAADEFELSGGGPADGTDLGGKTSGKAANGPPAWSELKTKAGKDRKRLPLACIACRRKKIRCSGEKPACKHCLRSRIPCVYKATTRKAAPRTDYMAMMDKRLKRMEERIIKAIPKSDKATTSTVTRAVVKPAIPGIPAGAKPGSKKRGAEEAFGSGLEAWAKAPSKAKSATEDDDFDPHDEAQQDDDMQLLQEGAEALPSRDIQEHLAEVYFDHVYGQAYLLLHKPSFMRKLKSDALPPVLVLSVCAVAARFSANPKLNLPGKQFLRGEDWASTAREICTKRYESPNMTILTCVLILGLHEFGTCQGARSWALGGQATRMAFALQLHRDLDHGPAGKDGQSQPLSFIDREIRRRIMWACFLMDRFNSSGSDRPMFIKDETIQIPLPVKERLFQLDMPARTETLDGSLPKPAPDEDQGDARENMGVAAFTIRAIALWGRITAYVNQGGRQLDSYPIWNQSSEFAKLSRQAEEFPASLPAPLQYTRENLALHNFETTVNQFLLLHLIIQQNILFVNRFAMLPSNGSTRNFNDNAMSKALVSASNITSYLREAENSRYSVTAPFAGYCAFSSTTVLIRGIASGDTSIKTTADANIMINIRFIRRMMKHWGMFHWMEENIRSQYRNAMDRARSGGPVDDASTELSMLQYGDWFDKYPHGLLDSEFMDSAALKRKEKGADGVLELKSELQSVEEFVTSLSPQGTDKREAGRAPASKRDNSGKKQGPASNKKVQRQPARQHQQQPPSQKQQQPQHPQQHEPLHIDTSVRPVMDQGTPQPQQQAQRRASAPIGVQTSGPTSFNPVTAPHSQAAAYASVTPISPVNVAHYTHAPPTQQDLFSPEMLSMNMQQPSNGIIQSLDHHLAYGGYSMDSGHVPTGHTMMTGLQEWDGVTSGGATNTPIHGQEPNHGFLNGQQVQGTNQMSANNIGHGMNGNGANAQAWFMPYDMESAGVHANMDIRSGNAETFSGIFGNNEMGAPNSLGGLRHAP